MLNNYPLNLVAAHDGGDDPTWCAGSNRGRPSISRRNKFTATSHLLFDWSRRVRVVAADRHSVAVTVKGWGMWKGRDVARVQVDVLDLSRVVTAARRPGPQHRIDHPGRRWNAYLQKLPRLLRYPVPELSGWGWRRLDHPTREGSRPVRVPEPASGVPSSGGYRR